MFQTIPERFEDIIPLRSRYYSRWTGRLTNSPHVDNLWKLPGDGWLSTAHDLGVFSEALYENKVISSETRELLWAQQRTNDGSLVHLPHSHLARLSHSPHTP